MECPCEICILKAICANKTIQVLIGECSILVNYLSPDHKRIRIEKLENFCETMNIQIEYRPKSISFKYRWL